MPEKLKLAIRLSADPKSAVKAFADLKKKSLDTRRALQKDWRDWVKSVNPDRADKLDALTQYDQPVICNPLISRVKATQY